MAQHGDMLPSSRLFRSRWAALFWAGGIVWLAVDVAGSAPHGGRAQAAAQAHDQVDQADVDAVANALDL